MSLHSPNSTTSRRVLLFQLITTGEAHSPVVAAWSEKALEEAVKEEDDKEDAMWKLKWTYAGSPYYCSGEQYFREVERFFSSRPDIWKLENLERTEEFEFRLRAMEKAMR